MNEKFATREFYLTCLLHALNIKIVGVKKQGNVCTFEFDDVQACNEIKQKLLTKDVAVNAADFISSIRVIKDLIFSSEAYNAGP